MNLKTQLDMPRFDLIQKMEVAMRFIYGHFLQEEETLPEFMESRKGWRAQIRHIVRFVMYNQFHCSYRQIAKAENKFDGLGERRDESTIGHSISFVDDLLNKHNTKGYRDIKQLLDQAMDYWQEFKSPKLVNDIQMLNDLPKHVLVIVLATGVQYGFFDRGKFEGLLTEFRTVSEEWFEDEVLSSESLVLSSEIEGVG